MPQTIVAGDIERARAAVDSPGFPTTSASVSQPWLPAKWDYIADVVVVGFGGAGASAAIEAHDAGASVLLLEKMPEGQEGGDTGVAGGRIATFSGPGSAAQNQNKFSFGTADPEVVSAFVNGFAGLQSWLGTVGVSVNPSSSAPGAMRVKGPFRSNTGYLLFSALKEAVNKRGVRVMYETSATDLIQDPVSKEVLGLKAATKQGTEVSIKANRGVVLASGGYSANQTMLNDFNHPGVFIACEGGPGNTGDGHKMLMKAGARIWHMAMALEWSEFSFKVPSQLYKTAISNAVTRGKQARANSYIFTNKAGKRFMNEKTVITHNKAPLDVLHFDGSTAVTNPQYTNMPFFMIFDEKARKSQPIAKVTGTGGWGWNTAHPTLHHAYVWSTDNSAEIAKGWVVQADTIQELAVKMTAVDWWGSTVSIDPAGLTATVSAFNGYCAAGADPQFGRPKVSLMAIDTPPYYGIEMCLTAIYTLGGSKIGPKGQVLDEDDKPLPRLYAAGSVAEYNVIRPGCLANCFVFGRIAGQNVAKETPQS